MNNNYIFLIVGESGCGKTTIVEQLEYKYGLVSIQSYTTRPKRNNSESGHIFVTDIEFDSLTNMVAYTLFNNYRYCATAEQVEHSDLYVIDPKGVKYFLENYKGNKIPKIIYINTDLSIRYERMKARAEENGVPFIQAVNQSLERIKNDVVEFYDYIHDNAPVDFKIKNNDDDIDSVVKKIYEYICSCNENNHEKQESE